MGEGTYMSAMAYVSIMVSLVVGWERVGWARKGAGEEKKGVRKVKGQLEWCLFENTTYSHFWLAEGRRQQWLAVTWLHLAQLNTLCVSFFLPSHFFTSQFHHPAEPPLVAASIPPLSLQIHLAYPHQIQT